MFASTVNDCIGAICENGLLEENQEEELRTLLRPQCTTTQDLAQELVRRGWLTGFQMKKLLRGGAAQLVVGPYVLLEELGRGGVGEVFKARQQHLKRLVALKIIRPDLASDPEVLCRFERECEAVANLAHPNIVALHDANKVVLEDDPDCTTLYYLAMELLEGTTLGRLLAQREAPLPVDLACDYARQAALGLQHAHEHGLVHRDIKPDNLFIADQGKHVKILDFGLVRGRAFRPMTEKGCYLGTPDYLAPEQWNNACAVDIRADVYSLGCTLYHMLTSRPPFLGKSMAEKMVGHLNKVPQNVEALRPGLPEGLPAVLRKMMAKTQEQRFQTPAEAAAALERFTRAGVPAEATPAERPAPREHVSPRPRLLLAAHSVRILSVCTAIGVLLSMFWLGMVWGVRSSVHQKMRDGRHADALAQIQEWETLLNGPDALRAEVYNDWMRNLGDLLSMGDLAGAVQSADQFLAWSPGNANASDVRREALRQYVAAHVSSLLKQEHFAQAAEWLKGMDPNDPVLRSVVHPQLDTVRDAWRKSAEHEFDQRRIQQALAICQALLAVFPDDKRAQALYDLHGLGPDQPPREKP